MSDPNLNRRDFLKRAGFCAAAFTAIPLGCSQRYAIAAKKPNVLFIAVDDLRPELNCYGQSQIISPNIDRLVSEGTVFNRAYCNVPTCGASRASLLTGLRPRWPDRFRGNGRGDKQVPDALTMPMHFKNNGYHAISNGKIFHNQFDFADSWSEEPWRMFDYEDGRNWVVDNFDKLYLNPESANNRNDQTRRGPFCESADVDDCQTQDGKLADKTIADLSRLSRSDRPFFMACGFWRPHLPFNAPKKYWDMYDRSKIELADNRYKPKDLPKQCSNSGEINSYSQVKGRKDSDEFHRQARHAYYACVSFIDAQVGRVLDTLDELGIADNTIIVLWGDHGWHLGEHTFWGKHNTLNNALQVPLVVKGPGCSMGKTDSLAELVDIYPTLCELTDLPRPQHLQGDSFAAVLKDASKQIKPAVYSIWQGGHAIKTDRYLYTQWQKDGKTTAHMLYDHKNDPDENTNIADDPQNKQLVEKLQQMIRTKIAS